MASEEIAVGMPLPRIRSVKALSDRRVMVTWENGPSEAVDLTPALASHRAFVRLRSDDELFRSVRVSEYHDCLEWPDGSELPASWVEELADAPLDNAALR